MQTPIKREVEDLTSTESTPLKVKEIFKCPLDMVALEEVKYAGSTKIIAENINNDVYDRFVDLNPRFSKLVYLFRSTIRWSEEYTDFGNESDVHQLACAYFIELNNNFGNAVASYNINRSFVKGAGNVSERGAGNNAVPDFRVKLEGRRNGFLIGEIQYSRSLRDGHERAQAFFEAFDDVRAVIVVNIRYPWNVTADGTRYVENDGDLLFLYYSRGGERDPESNERIPDRIISFGDTPITATEMVRVQAITHFPIDRLEGVGIEAGLVCNQQTINLPTFVHEVPAEVLLVVSPDDDVTLTNHPLNAVPENLRFIINLYDLKQYMFQGIREMNTSIGFGDAQIPTFTGYRL